MTYGLIRRSLYHSVLFTLNLNCGLLSEWLLIIIQILIVTIYDTVLLSTLLYILKVFHDWKYSMIYFILIDLSSDFKFFQSFIYIISDDICSDRALIKCLKTLIILCLCKLFRQFNPIRFHKIIVYRGEIL